MIWILGYLAAMWVTACVGGLAAYRHGRRTAMGAPSADWIAVATTAAFSLFWPYLVGAYVFGAVRIVRDRS